MRVLACAAVVWALSVHSALAAPPAFSPPHTEQLAAGVFAAGFSHRYEDATCGWAVLRDQTVMIDLPRGLDVRPFLDYVRATTGKPVKRVAVTRMRDGDDALLASLAKEGVARVPTTAAESPVTIGDESTEIEFIPYGNITGFPGGAIFLPQSKVLFGGPAVVNGPHADLTGSKTAAWSNELVSLRSLDPQRVVPGSGSWGGPQILERQQRFLTELRQQVAHGVSMGQSIERIIAGVRLPFSSYVWMPYDLPTPDDIKHIYRELTVPNAPFGGKAPNRLDSHPHALVLIGDRVHEPEHVEAGLRPVFEATKVVPHFTVDYHALNAKNLSHVSLLVVLRDGMLWPDGLDKPYRSWMTPEQEAAVVDFVTKGGAFLSLHNSMGLFPDNGPYLNLVGGHYTGHGPPERFSVKVVDRNHPITRGVEDYFISDEQHTPVLDSSSVHVLLVSGSDDGISAPAGWAYEPGKGRLVHLANGHTRDALNHPMFQRLMRNSVDWLLRRQ